MRTGCRTLGESDAVDANLRRLEGVWEEMRELIPDRCEFVDAAARAAGATLGRGLLGRLHSSDH